MGDDMHTLFSVLNMMKGFEVDMKNPEAGTMFISIDGDVYKMQLEEIGSGNFKAVVDDYCSEVNEDDDYCSEVNEDPFTPSTKF